MDIMECVACRGRKTVLGLGSLRVECPPCKGIGWTHKIAEDEEDAILNPVVEVTTLEFKAEPRIPVLKETKKPGRKKKEII